MMDDAVIQTQGLTKRYGKLVAVEDVNLEIPAGRVFALMGPNGAGKTSMIRMILVRGTSSTHGNSQKYLMMWVWGCVCLCS